MTSKKVSLFVILILTLSLLLACSPQNTPPPATATPSSTATPLPTATLSSTATPLPTATIPPTATLEPTQAPTQVPFQNVTIYDIPAMYQVTVETVYYETLSEPAQTLAMDIYYPADRKAGTLLPAVIMANAFPFNAPANPSFMYRRNDANGTFPYWGRIIAANGLIAVAYDTLNLNDLEAVVKHIQKNGAAIGIDGNRLGLFGNSSHAILASSFAYQENRDYLKFAVFYYGYLLTPENFMRVESNEFCFQWGCYSGELPNIKQLRSNLPVLIVRSGQDEPINTGSIDRFAQLAKEQNVPLTLILFEEGVHGFEWEVSAPAEVKAKGIEIIQQTVDFMKAKAFAQE